MKIFNLVIAFLGILLLAFITFEGGILNSTRTKTSLETLLNLKQYNGETQLILWKSRNGQQLHFDRLVFLEKKERQLLFKIANQDIDSMFLSQLDKFTNQKWTLIEKWKSAFALERNSLKYLPVLIANEPRESTDRLLLNKFLQDLFAYNSTPLEEDERRLRQSISRFNHASGDTTSLFHGVALHAGIFLDKKSEVDELFDALDVLNQESLIDHLIGQKETNYKEESELNQRLKIFLYIIGLLFLGLVIGTLRQLLLQRREMALVNASLEKKVKFRTEKVEEQNKKLVWLNEEKSNLIGVVAHELRSPLNRIKGWLEIGKLENLPPSNPAVEILEGIENAVRAQETLIQKILQVEENDTLDLKPTLKKTQPKQIILDVIQHCQETAVQKEIDLEYEFSPEDIHLNIDPDYFQQVVENLLSNALKFSPKNKKIQLRQFVHNDQFMFSVKDEGPGLDVEEQKKLFLKYQKLGPRPTAGEPSTGLGLSIVKKFVETMNGRVWCESEKGKGAEFIFSIPLHQPE